MILALGSMFNERRIGMESILTSIKKLLGITEECEHFDSDIIIHINSVLSVLTQLGVGPTEGFRITDKSSIWSDFVPYEYKNLDDVKTYVYLRVRLLFDPPISSIVIDSMNRMISELEWRINVTSESNEEEELQNG